MGQGMRAAYDTAAETTRGYDRAAADLGAYRELREAVVGGHFHPNERLVEADLARTLHVGRSAIRAALVRLDQEGLVTREPNRGARVRLISEKEALEVEEVRSALEQLMARHAAARAAPKDIADLQALLAEMKQRVDAGDPLGYSELNVKFHQRIWATADHALTDRLLRNLKSQAIRFQYRTILQPGRPQRSLREHQAIVKALEKGDPDAAEAAMRVHLDHVVATLRSAIEQRQMAPNRLAGPAA